MSAINWNAIRAQEGWDAGQLHFRRSLDLCAWANKSTAEVVQFRAGHCYQGKLATADAEKLSQWTENLRGALATCRLSSAKLLNGDTTSALFEHARSALAPILQALPKRSAFLLDHALADASLYFKSRPWSGSQPWLTECGYLVLERAAVVQYEIANAHGIGDVKNIATMTREINRAWQTRAYTMHRRDAALANLERCVDSVGAGNSKNPIEELRAAVACFEQVSVQLPHRFIPSFFYNQTAEDFSHFIKARYVEEHIAHDRVGKIAKQFVAILRHELEWEKWVTPGLSLFPRQAQESCAEKLRGRWWQSDLRRHEVLAQGGMNTDWALAHMEFLSAASRYLSGRSRWSGEADRRLAILEHRLERGEARLSKRNGTYIPSTPSLRLLQYSAKHAIPAPEGVLQQLYSLQKQAQVDFAREGMQQGLRTLTDVETLTKRIKNNDAVIYCLYRAHELIEVYVLYPTPEKFPTVAAAISHQTGAQGDRANRESIDIVSDMVVGKRNLTLRAYGVNAYDLLHYAVEGLAHEEYAGKDVRLLGLCRKDNLALQSHVQRGWTRTGIVHRGPSADYDVLMYDLPADWK